MKSDTILKGALRLEPCSYGLSKLSFRGPMRPTDDRYVAFFGGSETFGKYIPKPYPDLIETAIGEVCVNLGYQSAGPDVFLHDVAIQSLCHDAAAVVIQMTNAANLTNPFYKVHPRRNDRFIAPSKMLVDLYPEVDFSEIAFTGHLIARLRAGDEARFEVVLAALQSTWVRRMKRLITLATGPVFLLWFAPRTPEDHDEGVHPALHPQFVSRDMIEELRAQVADIIEVVPDSSGTDGMRFAPLDTLMAQETLGVDAHEQAAKALRNPLIHGLA